MAGLNGAGPNGQGKMTGRGMGNCAIVDNANNQQYFGRGVFGGGMKRGCGKGAGRGFRNQCFVNNQPNNIDFLKAQAEYLKNELEVINKNIDSLKNK